MKEVVALEKAQEEVDNWLDAKKVKPGDRVTNQKFISTLIEAIQYGNLELDADTNTFTQKLDFPLTNSAGTETLTSLKYNPRGQTGSLQSKTANLNGIGMAVYVAYASSLTGELVATLNRLDTEDFKVLQAIITFFL